MFQNLNVFPAFFLFFLENVFDNITNGRYINRYGLKTWTTRVRVNIYSTKNRKVSFQMKKMILGLGAIAAAAIVTSCAGVTANNGMPALIGMGPNFFSKISVNSMVGDVQSSYTVVKHGVTAEATLTSFFTAVNLGDASFETLKKEALEGVAADDLIDVRVDYDMNCICGINTVTVKLTGTAIKYK